MQLAVELLPDQPVPAGFNTQSIFLIANFDWLSKEKSNELRSLYESFEDFGRAIGPENAAIWFWRYPPNQDDEIANAIDVERGARLCAELGLTASKSPYLIITAKGSQDHAIFCLGGLNAAGSRKVLLKLADELIAGDLALKSAYDEIWWQTLYSSFRSVFGSFGQVARPFKISMNALFFKVEFDGTQMQSGS